MGRGCGAGGGLLWGSAVGRLGALWGCCGAALWHFITSLWGYMGSYGPAQHIYGSAPHLWVRQVGGAVQPDPIYFYRVMIPFNGTLSPLYGAIWVLLALPHTSMGPPHTCGSGRFEELSNLILPTSIGLYLRLMGSHYVFMGLCGFLWPCPTYLWVRPTLVGLGWV